MSTAPPPTRDPGQPSEHRAVFTEGRWVVEFETSQPAPNHWVAIGFASEQSPQGETLPPVMVVGSGATQPAAEDDLRRRVGGYAQPGIEDEFVMDWALMAVEEGRPPS